MYRFLAVIEYSKAQISQGKPPIIKNLKPLNGFMSWLYRNWTKFRSNKKSVVEDSIYKDLDLEINNFTLECEPKLFNTLMGEHNNYDTNNNVSPLMKLIVTKPLDLKAANSLTRENIRV